MLLMCFLDVIVLWRLGRRVLTEDSFWMVLRPLTEDYFWMTLFGFCEFFHRLLHELMSPHLPFVSPCFLLREKVIFVKDLYLRHYIRDWTNDLLPF